MAAATLTVKILADIADFEKNLSKSERAFLKSADTVSSIGKKMALGITLPFVAAAAALSKAAADDEASVAKLQRTFGTSARTMETWITQLMKTVPATDDEIRGLAVSTDTLLRSMNLSTPAAMRMTQQVTQLAGDLAAYGHVELGVAQDALEKALSGKTKGLQEFGVVISEADIKTRAYQMGLARTGAELTHAQTAQAAWSLILDKTKLQQGEAGRTIGDAANATKRLRQASDSAADSFGAVFLPVAARVVETMADFLNGMADLSPTMKSAIVVVGALAAATGPLVVGLGSVTRAVTVLRGALALFSGTTALAGLATIMTGLVPALLLAGGVAALFAVRLHDQADAARRAAGDTELYASAVDKLSLAQLKQQSTATRSLIDSLAQQKAGFLVQRTTAPNNEDLGAVKGSVLWIDAQIKRIDGQMSALGATLDPVTAKIKELLAPPASGGGEDRSLSDQLKDIESRAQAVIASAEQVKKGWAGIIPYGHEQIEVVKELNALLAKTSNAMDPIAVKARDILISLTGEGSASLTALVAKGVGGLPISMMSGTPVAPQSPFPGMAPTGWDMSHVFDIPATKIGEVSRAMTAGFQQVSVAIGDTLAQNLAAQLGGRGVGAQIGGSLGGAFGGGFGGYLGGQAASSIGGILGAGVGSVVPVVGTVVGTLIGGAIGGLFSHHKKAVESSASAIDKMAAAADKATEALSGLPEGYKIAYSRFLATTPVTPAAPVPPSVPGTPGSPGSPEDPDPAHESVVIVMHNPVFQGISDAPSFINSLTSMAEKHLARGGIGLRMAAMR